MIGLEELNLGGIVTDPAALQRLRFRWKNGSATQVGEEILRPIPLSEQVARAAAILDVCRTRCAPVPEVDAVSELARVPRRWHEGHEHFCAVRKLTLQEESHPTNATYRALLFVAENTAKTIYNATEPIDAFDVDAPFWLAKNALAMAQTINDSAFEDLLWRALIGA
jgi:hypothetical protein